MSAPVSYVHPRTRLASACRIMWTLRVNVLGFLKNVKVMFDMRDVVDDVQGGEPSTLLLLVAGAGRDSVTRQCQG